VYWTRADVGTSCPGHNAIERAAKSGGTPGAIEVAAQNVARTAVIPAGDRLRRRAEGLHPSDHGQRRVRHRHGLDRSGHHRDRLLRRAPVLERERPPRVEYFCIDCDRPAQILSMRPGDASPTVETTLAAKQFISDFVLDASAIWFQLEGTRSGTGIDYPPNDDLTGATVRVAHDGTQTIVKSGLPFSSTLTSDATNVYTYDATGGVIAIAKD